MHELKFGDDVREDVLKSAKGMYEAVASTMGAKGRNVIIKVGHQHPFVTKDGFTVAEYIAGNTLRESVGMEMVLEASARTNENAGDATSTSMVLTYNLLEQGVKDINKGATPISIKRGMDKANKVVQKRLDELAIKDFNIRDVALISANGDEEIADIITEAFNIVGKDGIINIVDGETSKTFIEHKDGMQIEHGYLTPHFVNNVAKNIAEYKKPRLLLVNGKILDVKHVMFHMQAAKEDEVPLVIIASEYGMEVVNMAATAKIKHGAEILLLEAPLFAEERTVIMTDLAHMTKSTLMSERTGTGITLGVKGTNTKAKVDSARKGQGTALSIISASDKTTIFYKVDEFYLDNIKELLKIKDKFARKRLAMLSGGVASIIVGGNSEIEVKERTHRVEDAVNSVRAAMQDGVCAGGGAALNEAREIINNLEFTDKFEKVGATIVYFTLYKPMEQILYNAGITKYVDEVYPYAIDVNTMEVVDMLEKGIIDPVKVVKEALNNAISVASTILTSGAMIIYSPE